MATESTDKELVKRVQKGDKGAFDLLVLKYEQKIVNLVMRYVRDPEQALDITQEAFIKAYRALPRFRGESAFYTWLYRIAYNVFLSHVSRPRPLSPLDEAQSYVNSLPPALYSFTHATMSEGTPVTAAESCPSASTCSAYQSATKRSSRSCGPARAARPAICTNGADTTFTTLPFPPIAVTEPAQMIDGVRFVRLDADDRALGPCDPEQVADPGEDVLALLEHHPVVGREERLHVHNRRQRFLIEAGRGLKAVVLGRHLAAARHVARRLRTAPALLGGAQSHRAPSAGR